MFLILYDIISSLVTNAYKQLLKKSYNVSLEAER